MIEVSGMLIIVISKVSKTINYNIKRNHYHYHQHDTNQFIINEEGNIIFFQKIL